MVVMKKLLGLLGVAVTILAAILLLRAVRLASKQPPPENPVQIEVDAGAAAEHLAGAIRYRTVSYEDTAKVDRRAFDGLHAYLASAYPKTHATLSREVINGSSLL